MAELCAQQDDPRGLLDASEAAKGRTLADLLTHRNRAASDKRVLRPGAAEVEKLTQTLGVHYLAFLIDEEKSFAALVTKAGRWHKSLIPLGRKHLLPLARVFHPSAWKGTLFDKGIDPTVELAPLFSWLEPLLKQGEIARNDHIIYSADEHLHQFPLHAVDFCG